MGREAIAATFQHVAASGVHRVQQQLIDMLASDSSDQPDTVIEQSHLTFYTRDGQLADRGKYVIVYTNEKGTWKILWNIFNSDGPTAQSA